MSFYPALAPPAMPSVQDIRFVNNCLICVPVALFLYDWVITFGDEVELIWRRKLSWKSDQPIFVLVMLLQVRVYVIYNRSRIVLWTNIVLFAIEAAIIIYLFLDLFSRANLICHTASCSAYPRSFGFLYITPLAFELYLLVLVACKAWPQRKTFRQLGHESILDALIRGSVVYFALVASGMAVSMILFLAAPKYVDWLDLLSDAMASIGGTRLILSTRHAVLLPELPTQVSTALYIGDPSYHRRRGQRSGRDCLTFELDTGKPEAVSGKSYITF
ncbi:hypothetical protein AURDEDRAFT_164218 [Auricularia subglabra TFB-10046 SS5]|nr:hypothetical protein AURDEDRAFT_164218 [Auricularia subglabra TFB-10046 SS5]